MTSEDKELLIHDFLDGSISDEDFRNLQVLLRTDEETRLLYREVVFLHSSLQQHSYAQDTLATNVVPMERVIRRQKRKTIKIAAFSAAALLIIGLIVMSFFMVDNSQPPLAFKSSNGTQFTLTHSSDLEEQPEGLVLQTGSNLKVTQGTVELSFNSGVKAIVQSPANITLHAEDTLYMHEGTAWFEVPKGAEGFKVNTEELNITDLGTEFGVIAHPKKHDEVYCIKGKILVEANQHRKESIELTAGNARSPDAIGKLATISYSTDKFLTTLPETLPYLHWSFDKIENEQLLAHSESLNTEDSEANFSFSNKNSTTIKPGKFGKAAHGIRAEHVKSTWKGFSGNTPRSIAFWIKIQKTDDFINHLVGWGEYIDSDSTHAFYTFAQNQGNGNEVGLSLNGYWVVTTTKLDPDAWRHITFVYTGKTTANNKPEILTYINGKLDETHQCYSNAEMEKQKVVIDTITDANESKPLTLFGDAWTGYPLEASTGITLDELYIFEGAIDEKTIENLYKHNSPNRK